MSDSRRTSRVAFAVFCMLSLGCTPARSEALSEEDKQRLATAVEQLVGEPAPTDFRWHDLKVPAHRAEGDFLDYCFEVKTDGKPGAYRAAYTVFQRRQGEIANAFVMGIDTDASDRIANLCRSKERDTAPAPPHALTTDQVRAGCSVTGGKLFCPRPGTGLCWEKGHNPLDGEAPARTIDVGVDPRSPDYNHPERCG